MTIEWTEDLQSRQATKRDLEDIARALGVATHASNTVAQLRAAIRVALPVAVADRDDYERRWLAECRAHGATHARLANAHHELGEHSLCGDDCSPDNAD